MIIAAPDIVGPNNLTDADNQLQYFDVFVTNLECIGCERMGFGVVLFAPLFPVKWA